MSEINVLLDGWELVYQPQSSAAQHLVTLITTRPAGVQYTLAVPGPPPGWLPGDVQVSLLPTANTSWGRLSWEQRKLPSLAKLTSFNLLHLVTQTPPLSISIPVVVSPADDKVERRTRGFFSRLRAALATGAMSRVSTLFWPDDLPPPEVKLPVYKLPPVVFPGLSDPMLVNSSPPDGVDLPDTYLLYPGILDELGLHRLMNVWSWVYSSVGEYFKLVLSGLPVNSLKDMDVLLSRFGLEASLLVLPALSPQALPSFYHSSSVVFQMGSIPPWGNSARNALASARPFVASNSKEMDAIVGPAAYLVSTGDERALSAALITVLVEDSLSEQLSQAAQERSSAWSVDRFNSSLVQAYLDIRSP